MPKRLTALRDFLTLNVAERIRIRRRILSPLGSSPPPDPRLHKSKQAGKKKGRTMNPLIQLKQTAPLLLITLTLYCFALLPQAQAVVPPPDGGYPGLNTAEGQN